MFTLKRYFLLPACCILLFVGCALLKGDKESNENVAQAEEVEKPEEPKGERVLIQTEYGDMIVELHDETPIHKENFLKLAGSGFYDSTLFHRVINGFMIQGGDPDSKGAPAGMRLGNGGPDYTLEAELDTTLIHKKGALAAARKGDGVNPEKRSSGSQFYIVQGKIFNDAGLDKMERNIRQSNPGFSYTEEQREIYKTIGGTPHLDMGYTVFGQVVEGVNVIDSIAAVRTRGSRPVEDVIMTMEIIE
jgi:peptidyl-prolyl cis-trans isomerase B (cyclophilin B)